MQATSRKDGKKMKQFGRTMLTVMSLAVAAAMSSSIPAQAQAGSSVVTHGYNTNLGIFDFNVGELTFINVNRTANSYMFAYQMFGPFSGAGSGSIPASSVNVSGPSVNTGKVTFALNVNTCGLDPASFTTSQGSCGTFDITWVQMPASVGGSTITSGTTQQTTPGAGTTIINGHTQTFNALLTGTALGYALPNCCGQLEELTNATVTITK
jgi:hypothetical protein